MPLPWKKAKVNRISRLVADLHQSPKRGGSLVVETGFPTSLIDLFVKNQDRWRKSSRRKSSPSPSPSPAGPDPDPQISIPLHSPPNSSSSPTCMQEVGSPVINVGEAVLVECEERVAFHPAKVLLVVALAVGTRMLAIWIMMAAFLLVLLEFVGTRFFGFLRPQSLMLFLGSWLQNQKALLVLKKRWWDWEQGSQQEFVAQQQQHQQEQQQGILLSDSCHGVGYEVHIAESKTDSITVEEGCERISEILEKSREMSIGKSGRRERIKATLIRKFVPKKLRKGNKQGKKKKSQSQEEELCSDQVDISLEKLEKLNKIEEEEDNDESGVQVEVEIEEEESCKEGEGGERVSTCSVQVMGMGLGVESQKEKEKAKAVDGKGKSGSEYLILIVLGMVLAGLLGGRGLSLLLTLVCCLVATYLSSSSSSALLSRVLSQSQSQGRKLRSLD